MKDLLEAEARRHVGRVIAGRYELLRLLGCGGMGAVYEARHQRTRGRVAVKLLLHGDDGSSVARRFAREARVLTRLVHPNIVRVHDLGDDGGTPYLVEDLLDGTDLRARLRERGACSPAEAVAWMLPLLDALEHAHAEGVVHRDVKPENVVMVGGPAGPARPVLIDFGVARVDDGEDARTRTGALLGTPAYMAPEQCRAGSPVDARADVWSAGVLLFELLTGAPPFAGAPAEVIGALLTLDAPRLRDRAPAAPAALDEALARALARSPDARLPSARTLADALRACGPLPSERLAVAAPLAAQATQPDTGRPSAAPRNAPAPRPRTPPPRRLLAAAALVALAAAVALARAAAVAPR